MKGPQLSSVLGTLTLAILAGCTSYLAVSKSRTAPIFQTDLRPEETSPISQPTRALQTLPSPRPDIYYAAITDRPLFAPERRPSIPRIETVPETEEVAVAAPVRRHPDGLTLSGVLDGGEYPKALIAVGSSLPDWYQVGDVVDGWSITRIFENAIILTEGDGSHRLELFQ